MRSSTCASAVRLPTHVPMYLHAGSTSGSYCGNIPMAVAMRLRVATMRQPQDGLAVRKQCLRGRRQCVHTHHLRSSRRGSLLRKGG